VQITWRAILIPWVGDPWAKWKILALTLMPILILSGVIFPPVGVFFACYYLGYMVLTMHNLATGAERFRLPHPLQLKVLWAGLALPLILVELFFPAFVAATLGLLFLKFGLQASTGPGTLFTWNEVLAFGPSLLLCLLGWLLCPMGLLFFAKSLKFSEGCRYSALLQSMRNHPLVYFQAGVLLVVLGYFLPAAVYLAWPLIPYLHLVLFRWLGLCARKIHGLEMAESAWSDELAEAVESF
jgi:hypothetical protein